MVAPPWLRRPEGRPFPSTPWADHMVRALVAGGNLPSPVSKTMVLNLWSDCSGIHSEMHALKELSASIMRITGADVQWNLFYACDADPQCIALSKQNFAPRHDGKDMRQRNFQTGEIWCSTCSANIPMPQSGLDLYVGTYPCSPWSRRGPRTGWDHPSAELFHIGMETLAFLHPATWIIEVGEMPENDSIDDVVTRIQAALRQHGRDYTIQALRNLMPASSGYAMRRTRTFFMGWRADLGSRQEVVAAAATLVQHPIDVTMSYRGFLGLASPYDWSGVNEYLVGPALASATSSPCRCSIDPMVVCPEHPCKCRKCGPAGVDCTWRKLFLTMACDRGVQTAVRHATGIAPYCKVLELQGGKAPTQQRARVLLNIVAALPESLPLKDSLVLVDTSQNPPFGPCASDGMVPTLTTSSLLWCLSAGRYMEVWETAALMGIDTHNIEGDMSSEAWFRARLGAAVHVPNFGFALLALLAKPLRDILGNQ